MPRSRRLHPVVPTLRIAVDTGGTFTDCVFLDRGKLGGLKLLSTPDDPATAILQGVAQIRGDSRAPLEVRHGTTVGTNALLERKGGRVVLLTTAGFEDILVIGRQQRARLYDLAWSPPPPLVPTQRRLGVAERVAADGGIIEPLQQGEIERVVRAVRALNPDSIALCLLFAFRAPQHERQLAEALATVAPVTASHALVPEIREFERTSTVVVNAYLQPRMAQYLDRLSAGLGALPGVLPTTLRVMQSSGGMIGAATAAREPVCTVLSGPAGGVIGAHTVAALSGVRRVLSFDMGGTSTDVALIAGQPGMAHEAQVTGLPLQLPMLDIHTVGSGGGSLARFDAAGALRVGPESAGADPGPIAYGRGGEQPTVTDAHILLGRLDPARFLGGHWTLDAARTKREVAAWLRRLRRRETPGELAAGIVAVANAAMERALRLISIERGIDPRDFTLVAFGGAGGLHACELATALQLRSVLIPIHPGALSALGILLSDVVRDFSCSLLWPASVAGMRSRLQEEFRRLDREAAAAMSREGFSRRRMQLERTVAVRYVGQGFELELPWDPRRPLAFLVAFPSSHQQRYGYADAARPLELAGIRVRARGLTPAPDFPRSPVRSHAARAQERRAVIWQRRTTTAAVYERGRLAAGAAFDGPALISEYSASTILPPGWRGRIDAVGNMILKNVE